MSQGERAMGAVKGKGAGMGKRVCYGTRDLSFPCMDYRRQGDLSYLTYGVPRPL